MWLVCIGILLACLTGIAAAWRVLGGSVVRQPRVSESLNNYQGPLQCVVTDINGDAVNLTDYLGKVVLVVNVASRCGFTKQYAALESLYQRYRSRGLVILGFPSNDFGGQEPGSNAEIKAFCTSTYAVSFPIMSKISIRGSDPHPFYRQLTVGDFAGKVGWNFTKFLLDRSGHVCARFGTMTRPDSARLITAIENALAKE